MQDVKPDVDVEHAMTGVPAVERPDGSTPSFTSFTAPTAMESRR